MEKRSTIENIFIIIKGCAAALLLLIVSQYFTLLIFIPPVFPADKRKKFYKKNLKWIANFILKTHPNIKTSYINPNNEDFNKPAVIIVNHQTFFDVLVTFSLSYKLFVITNDWLQHTFFKSLMKKYLMDNVTITKGNEAMVASSEKVISGGYSPIIFPEGARIKGPEITRFHKGAFLMAALLNIEILPVVIYGSEEIHKKKWFYFKKGEIKVYIGKRISPCKENSHDEIRNQTKEMAKYFREKYHTLQSGQIPNL